MLEHSQITDAGLVHLKELDKLTSVAFQGTKVTDAGLLHLKDLNKLTFLNLADTYVTDEGVDELKETLPNCRVSMRRRGS